MIPDRVKPTPADVVKDIAAIVLAVLFLFSCRIGIVSGNSMSPTLGDGDYVVYSSITFCGLRSGDIIVFDNKDCGALIKRVIGCPGDVISIKGGVVYLNGGKLTEDYTAPGLFSPGDIEYPLHIPSGCYFVMGDNRKESRDSRMRCVGLVSDGQILGVVRCVL